MDESAKVARASLGQAQVSAEVESLRQIHEWLLDGSLHAPTERWAWVARLVSASRLAPCTTCPVEVLDRTAVA
jgi:hypothetical protein